MTRHIFRRSKGVPDKRLLHPRREWGIGLCLFTVVLFVGSGFGAQSFTQFKDVTAIEGQAELSIPRYNENQIKSVLEVYQERSDGYRALISDTALVSQFSNPATSSLDSATSTEVSTSSASNAEVSILAEFPEKLVYGDNLGELNIPAITDHCAAAGGTLNECGSVCPATAQVCTDQCAYTCEFE